MKYLPSGLNNGPLLLVYLTEIEMHIELQTLPYLNTSYLQYSLRTVLLTLGLVAQKAKLLTELLVVPNLTFTDHTEFKDLNR